jgi:NTP pyrophosphatase (non-canonical NTP hydrolase)
MDFTEMKRRAIEIRAKYDKLNRVKRGASWDGPALMAGFVGDVGDLSKITMAKAGLRDMTDVDAKLAHELADCLWSVLVLADYYQVDLAAAFQQTMELLDERIDNELAAQ